MRGYFEGEDDEREEGQQPVRRTRDTELTLGAGVLLGIFFGLVFLCGLCFWLGYSIGHHGPVAGGATQSGTQTAAPDQEPLQASGSIPKPSADAQAPASPPASADAGAGESATDNGGNSPSPGPALASQGSSSTNPGAPSPQAQPQVQPAMPSTTTSQAAPPAFSVHQALPAASAQFLVQVAAVSHEEDADVLVNALRRHGYAVSSKREPSDGLIHVRIGPFATRDEANRMCTRLLDDGYNAMIQPQ